MAVVTWKPVRRLCNVYARSRRLMESELSSRYSWNLSKLAMRDFSENAENTNGVNTVVVGVVPGRGANLAES